MFYNNSILSGTKIKDVVKQPMVLFYNNSILSGTKIPNCMLFVILIIVFVPNSSMFTSLIIHNNSYILYHKSF